MGHLHSKPIAKDDLGRRLLEAVSNDKNLVAFPDKRHYQKDDVRTYNLSIKVTPKAVTYPKTSAQVAAIVKCAVDFQLKVQARSGGHSYGNFGILFLITGLSSR